MGGLGTAACFGLRVIPCRRRDTRTATRERDRERERERCIGNYEGLYVKLRPMLLVGLDIRGGHVLSGPEKFSVRAHVDP